MQSGRMAGSMRAWCAGRGRERWLRLVYWGVFGAGVASVVWRLTVGLDSFVLAPIAGASVVAIFLLARGWGDWGVLVAYGAAMGFFIQLRDAADETSIAALSAYVIDWELWMFGGIRRRRGCSRGLGGRVRILARRRWRRR